MHAFKSVSFILIDMPGEEENRYAVCHPDPESPESGIIYYTCNTGKW
jgi:hypothetical protein